MLNFETRNCPICTSKSSELLREQSFGALAGLKDSEFEQKIHCCSECGMIYVREYFTDEQLSNYYSNMWTYEFAEKSSDYPEAHRKRSEQQFEFISRFRQKFGHVLDIGCSLGYTLSLFKETGSEVLGIEPSAKLKELASKKYDIKVVNEFITKDFVLSEKFDLVILSHVAEHLKFPTEMLSGISNVMKTDAYLYIEVPTIEAFDERDLFQFSFEHINYFSHGSLTNLMHLMGFDQIDHIIFENANGVAPFYPTLGTLWRKSCCKYPLINRKERDSAVIRKYISLIDRHLGDLTKSVNDLLSVSGNVAIWGAGTLTAQLLAQTPLGKSSKVSLIYDNDPKKHGLSMAGIPIKTPESANFMNDDKVELIVIGSWSSQNEIYDQLVSRGLEQSQIRRLFQTN